MKQWVIFVLIFTVSTFLLGGCSEPFFVSAPSSPTPTLTSTLTEIPVPTHTSTRTATPTPTATPTLTASPTPGTVYQLQVPADIVWYSTKIVLHTGQTLIISAQGTSNISGQPNNSWIPDSDDGSCPFDCLLPGVGYGTLIGKISVGQPFKIGASLSITVPIDGTLFLAINDNYPYYWDNTGFYDVEIRIW